MSAAPGPAQSPEPSPWNLPNALTVLRIILVPVYGWLLLTHGGEDATLRWWAFVVFVVAMATDKIDGDLARSRGLVTNFGKIADPIADKALTGMGFIGLSIIGDIPWVLTIIVLVREWGITALRFVVIRHGVMPAGRGGKLKTVLQAVSLTLFTMPLWTLPLSGVWVAIAWIVLIAAVLVTVVTGVDYVIKARQLVAGSARTAERRASRGGS
ncbi:CDP-diacylglycerol--glycerol-3-phosphate 3-phosphatidyltransferase [Kribbia dieselivorans]|uniref:CDP-diacylglycerol--glycerol-3-phosphate 3-phosphatidyltransferase n=1 Tax=Kribbia dieselivorans TaxID=331526 RepID=UPI00083975C4|nr:CDP-diacylglycerol--glycerol-3-phosphate 3-phosphatidyltransferase [Kribbia dieselivorans]